MTDGLFEMEPTAPVVALPEPGMSADRRRTARQKMLLARGLHPAAPYALHADAAHVTEPNEPGKGLRCDSCAHLDAQRHHDRTYIKCEVVGITHGTGTDMRRWWPACTRWTEAQR
jgi:hypothetical protein